MKTESPLFVYFAGVEYVERSAYDALAARLAAVEKERDEAVALLARIAGNRGSVVPVQVALDVAELFTRLANPEAETK